MIAFLATLPFYLALVVLHLALVVLSFYVVNLAHEMGHVVGGQVVGLPIRKVFIGLPTEVKQTDRPSFSLLGIAFYFGYSSLYAFVKMDMAALYRLPPKARITVFMAGPLSGTVVSIAWIIASFYCFVSIPQMVFQMLIGALWVKLNLGNLRPDGGSDGGNDGYGIREAWHEIHGTP